MPRPRAGVPVSPGAVRPNGPSKRMLPPRASRTSSSNRAADTFPWCVKPDVSIADGYAEVRFKPLSGREHQAGGLVWRWKDGDNYYVARANALENNVSLYYTQNGRRNTLKDVKRARPGKHLAHAARGVCREKDTRDPGRQGLYPDGRRPFPRARCGWRVDEGRQCPRCSTISVTALLLENSARAPRKPASAGVRSSSGPLGHESPGRARRIYRQGGGNSLT